MHHCPRTCLCWPWVFTSTFSKEEQALLQQMSCGADPARVLAMIHDLGKRVPHNRMGYVLSTPVWVPKSGQPYRVITPLYKFVTALGCDGRIMLVQPGDFVRGCKAVVHLLLHYGVCPNLGASDNSYKCVEVPLAGRHPGRIERNHGSPLSAAAVIRSPDVYQMLLHAGALPALWHVWGVSPECAPVVNTPKTLRWRHWRAWHGRQTKRLWLRGLFTWALCTAQ
jgi:hypothetical protein